jgi:hypothetical protein
MTTNSDVEQQQQSPGRQRRGGLDRSLGERNVNFSDYLNAQRKFSSQRFLHRRTSVRNLRVTSSFISEEGEEVISEEGEEDQNADRKKINVAPSSRHLHRLSSAEWNDIFDDLGNIDENGQFHDAHAHMKPFYSPPVQRQRWGEDQVYVCFHNYFFLIFSLLALVSPALLSLATHSLPHVNWGEFVALFLT